MRMRVRSLASLSGLRICCCCKLRCRLQLGSDPVLLWLWCRPAAAAPIWRLAWELPYATGGALKRKKKNKRWSSYGNTWAVPLMIFFLCLLEIPAIDIHFESRFWIRFSRVLNENARSPGARNTSHMLINQLSGGPIIMFANFKDVSTSTMADFKLPNVNSLPTKFLSI